MIDITWREVVAAVGGTTEGLKDGPVLRGVSTDSRQVRPGELYVPLRGERFDGHDFLAPALAAGAAAVLYARGAQAQAQAAIGERTVLALEVDDTLRALGDLARALVRKSRLPTLAITGSAGKTSTKEMMAAMLATSGPVCATPGNFNNLVGLPLTVFQCAREHRFLVLEMGMNAPGEIARLTEIAAPDVALVTNVGAAHIGNFGSLEGVAEAKGELYAGMPRDGLAVVNADDPLVRAQAERRGPERVRRFGRAPEAEVRIEEVTVGTAGTTEAILRFAGARRRIQLGVLGAHNVWNAAAALAACLDHLSSLSDAIAALAQHRGPRNRMERVEHAGAVILSDCYNANPTSTEAALLTLASIPVARRRLAILGDMLELGEHADEAHRRVGERVAQLGIDQLFAVGAHAAQMAEGARAGGMTSVRIQRAEDVLELTDRLDLRKGDWVLLKGSRGLRMERLLEALGAR